MWVTRWPYRKCYIHNGLWPCSETYVASNHKTYFTYVTPLDLFSRCVAVQVFRYSNPLDDFRHFLQMCTFSLLWITLCVLISLFDENDWWQILHIIWVFSLCSFNWPGFSNAWMHTVQKYCFLEVVTISFFLTNRWLEINIVHWKIEQDWRKDSI